MPEYWIQWEYLWEHFPRTRNGCNQNSLSVGKSVRETTNDSNSPFFSSDGEIAESTSGKLLFFSYAVYTKQQ